MKKNKATNLKQKKYVNVWNPFLNNHEQDDNVDGYFVDVSVPRKKQLKERLKIISHFVVDMDEKCSSESVWLVFYFRSLWII